MRHALLGTLPGRAMVAGVATKLVVLAVASAVGQPAWLQSLDAIASVALIVVALYFLSRGVTFVKRRLLWRVRRKLIISYIFIGFVPALLIVAFFLLGGLLLFSNFNSFLAQSAFQTLADDADSLARMTAVELQQPGANGPAVLERRRAAADREFPGVSFAIVGTDRPCDSAAASPIVPADSTASNRLRAAAGSWAHASAPSLIPAWITCDGFRGALAIAPARAALAETATARAGINYYGPGEPMNLVIRGVRFPEGAAASYAVVVDVPIGQPIFDRLDQETGVTLTDVETIDLEMGSLAALAPTAGVAPPAAASSNLPLTRYAFLDYADWATGRRSWFRATIRLDVTEVYQRLTGLAGTGRGGVGQTFLLVLLVIGVLFLIIEALALAAGLALARSITGSVHALFEGTERVRRGDFTHKIDVQARDQLGELAASFNLMTASIEDLLREQAEKKRLEEELRIAHEIQMSLLPQGPLGVRGLSVTALCVPAREVGGDYYDFLPLDEHRVGVLIADVSGKGTSAALYMAELKGLVLSLSRIHTSPRDLLIMANRIIAPHLDTRSFITMTYAVVDLRARTMTYARAGHTPLMYLPAAGASRQLRVLTPDGMVVGLKVDNGEMFERLLREEVVTIHENDLFLFFTDGISEAMNGADECFGETRLAALIEEHAHLPSEELRERVLREIAAFVGDAPPHDDMTMILLRIGAPLDVVAVEEPVTSHPVQV